MVIEEMGGLVDGNGRSPFWECLGRVFFDTDFPNADYLSMVNKKFIADLMPTHPIYIPLLPKEAQEAIGQVQEQTRPAVKLLGEEGVHASGLGEICEVWGVLRWGGALGRKGWTLEVGSWRLGVERPQRG